jgi:hypothetical protein
MHQMVAARDVRTSQHLRLNDLGPPATSVVVTEVTDQTQTSQMPVSTSPSNLSNATEDNGLQLHTMIRLPVRTDCLAFVYPPTRESVIVWFTVYWSRKASRAAMCTLWFCGRLQPYHPLIVIANCFVNLILRGRYDN